MILIEKGKNPMKTSKLMTKMMCKVSLGRVVTNSLTSIMTKLYIDDSLLLFFLEKSINTILLRRS